MDGDIRLLSDENATMVSKRLLELSEQNFQKRITSRTGQLFKALQQASVQTVFGSGTASVTLTPADLPGMARSGSRSTKPRPNTGYYGPVVFGSGPKVFHHTPVIFDHAPVVFNFGPNGTRSPFDFDTGQQTQLTDEVGGAMVNNIFDAYKDFYHR